jgi:hypothetical protein
MLPGIYQRRIIPVTCETSKPNCRQNVRKILVAHWKSKETKEEGKMRTEKDESMYHEFLTSDFDHKY